MSVVICFSLRARLSVSEELFSRLNIKRVKGLAEVC